MPKSLGQLNFKNKKKVVMAMSGGIDSSVAAALLKRAGLNLIGVFMKFWSEPLGGSTLINADSNADLRRYENRCCSSEAEARARKVAKILKIPFYVFNFEKEFKKRIVDYFLREYKAGQTPNPCVICNKEIKFGLLLEKALALNADYIATGHYARIKRSPNFTIVKNSEKVRLLRAKDKKKDQSYFLWQLNQEQLKHILFPVGNYTKSQVKALAKKFKLPVLNIPESMEICFIPDKLENFLARYIKSKPGPILNQEGKKIGKHQGLAFYTIGQRKGIELSGGPFYVVKKEKKRNALIVASLLKDEALYTKELIAKSVNWISGREPELPLKVSAQIRYGHQPTPAIITKTPVPEPSARYGAGLKPKTYNLKFNNPQRAITPGQSVVFYQKNELLAGGIIC